MFTVKLYVIYSYLNHKATKQKLSQFLRHHKFTETPNNL